MSHTYKNKTNLTLVLPDIGIVLAGGVIQTDKVIENPNLELVTEQQTTVENTKTEETA